jgi:magnesium transporter
MNRIPWLFILMCLTALTGILIERYEDSLAVMPALVAFVPVLMNTGGNAGTQSSTMIIRGMALGEIELPDVLRVLGKELVVSLVCGSILLLSTYASVLLFGESGAMAFTVGLAMMATIIMSNLVGGFLTFLAKVVRVDPAIMAAPLLTNIIDAGSLIVYFNLAKGILKI